MSSAADNFHPGFSPESSLMLLSPAGLLAHAATVLPSHNAMLQWCEETDVLKSKSIYSYGNSTGFTPVSLLMALDTPTRHAANLGEIRKLIRKNLSATTTHIPRVRPH